MNDDFRIGRGLALGGALLVIVLGSALIVLSACSPKAETPDVPNVPETTGAIDAPEAPKSASQIMRISEIDFASYSRDLASSVGLELIASKPSSFTRYLKPKVRTLSSLITA